ncbi:MAG TPA: MFS transporter [Capsulimonadaceae bacterium]|nr:MFS transporter [Capsulimonadaceae bacterium]
MATDNGVTQTKRYPLGLTGYQWAVLFVAWIGWGFDVFDGLLFNYVAPNCVPTLLHIPIGTPEAAKATAFWTGRLTSLLLIGWAVGGVLFGQIADRIGRSRTLMLTMVLYAVGTAACAFAPNLWWLIIFRGLESLGIGGEWAAGAAMVSEAVPEKRRVEAGALLYTSAPAGLFLATFVVQQIAGVYMKTQPELSWRYIFLSGLVPAAFAVITLAFVREPERWQKAGKDAATKISELFTPENRRLTLSGFVPAVVVLITWWSCNAFNSVVATDLAQAFAKAHDLDKVHTQVLVEHWKAIATNSFNWGGLIGTLLTIPAAKYLGRRVMFFLYLLLSSASIFATFALNLPPEIRLYFYFFIGLTVFGVFGSFTFYLPELFPTRLRATGAGFCYNIGRLVAAIGPILVGQIAKGGVNALHSITNALIWIGFVPLIGICFLPWVIETRNRQLSD